MAQQASESKVLYLLLALVVVIVVTLTGYHFLTLDSNGKEELVFSPGETLQINHQFLDIQEPIRVYGDAEAMEELLRVQHDPRLASQTERRLYDEQRVWWVEPGVLCEYVQGDDRQAEITIKDGEHAGKSAVVQPQYLFPPDE